MRRVFNMLLGGLLGFAVSFGIIALSETWGWPAFLLLIPVVLVCIAIYIWADRREKYWRARAEEARRQEADREASSWVPVEGVDHRGTLRHHLPHEQTYTMVDGRQFRRTRPSADEPWADWEEES